MPKFIVTTLLGLEPVLEQELIALGCQEVEVLNRACSFEGDKTALYRVNYEARTAIRVLYPILEFEAQNEKELYKFAQHLEWDKFMDVRDTFAIRSVVNSFTFKHSNYAGLTVKDAIVDQFRDKYDRRPDIDVNNPTIALHLYIKGEQCTLLLDASGDSLHLRGYRREQLDAPLNEVLAAGMLLLAGYDGSQTFIDPMCGSGTLAVEAAMIATCMPAQKHRRKFAMEKWKNFDSVLWKKVKENANAAQRPAPMPIYARDIAQRGRNGTAINAMGAELERAISIEKADFFKEMAPAESGILVCNPPYDERLELEDAVAFYKRIGDTFKQNYPGWKAWVISSNTQAFKLLGLKTFKKHHLMNGALECWYRGFEIRSGSFFPDEKKVTSEEEE